MRVSLILMAYIFACLSNSSAADEIVTEIDVLANEPVVLRFKAVDPHNVRIDEQWLIGNIAENLERNSVVNQFSAGGAKLGVVVDIDTSKIIFDYHDRSATRYQSVVIAVGFQATVDAENIVITLLPPEKATLTNHRRLFFGGSNLTRPMRDEIVADFSTIIRNAPSIKFRRVAFMKGEESCYGSSSSDCLSLFNSAFSRFEYSGGGSGTRAETIFWDTAHYDVFQYRLPAFSAKGFIARSEYVQVGREYRAPLKVEVLTNSNGFSVRFESSLPYLFGADGSAEGYDLPDKLALKVHDICTARLTFRMKPICSTDGDNKESLLDVTVWQKNKKLIVTTIKTFYEFEAPEDLLVVARSSIRQLLLLEVTLNSKPSTERKKRYRHGVGDAFVSFHLALNESASIEQRAEAKRLGFKSDAVGGLSLRGELRGVISNHKMVDSRTGQPLKNCHYRAFFRDGHILDGVTNTLGETGLTPPQTVGLDALQEIYATEI